MTESQRTQKVATFCMDMINKYTSNQDNRVVHVCHKKEITELAKIEFPTNWKTIVKILYFGY
jgi:benzoyl-CoA reductase/2-hydroxyglutaryl-CoA dehydratase subunit BcrC/BadD/HgdB